MAAPAARSSGQEQKDQHAQRKDQSEIGNIRSHQRIEGLLRIFNMRRRIFRFMNPVNFNIIPTIVQQIGKRKMVFDCFSFLLN